MIAPALFSSATDEWATPQALFDELNAEFGFTLDVCANAANAKCAHYIAANSLGEDWTRGSGAVWCNPPYGREIGDWVGKALFTSMQGRTVVALLPARTDTRWWHASIWDSGRHRPYARVEVRFIRGRLKFGGSKNSAPFPSAIVVFRAA